MSRPARDVAALCVAVALGGTAVWFASGCGGSGSTQSDSSQISTTQFASETPSQKQAGVVLPNFRRIDQAVHEMLGSLDAYRANVARIENRAVFEIPEILAKLIDVH